jgi:hypothetical protein
MTDNNMLDAADGSTESHVDRAMHGPTPDNPSLSLKTRLKRAAFFDKREREVAAGTAEPVDADAGLPEAGVEEGFTLEPEGAADETDVAAV